MAKLNITQVKSRIGSTKLQKKNLDALGLRKMNRTVQHNDSPIILGMIEKVRHLVTVEQVQETEKKTARKPAAKKAAPKADAEVPAQEPAVNTEVAAEN